MSAISAADSQFIGSLGLTVIEVEPDGVCAAYNAETGTVSVCKHLCPGRGSTALARLLGRIDLDDTPTV